ncbi:MAG: phosphate ABC transporter substrate-binding protein PstS [Deltaproteobacteria bacterium]|nr:phosphate ABC transporter substrate-binding protein PstS [Candidatus Zymogenaceae bacterium]
MKRIFLMVCLASLVVLLAGTGCVGENKLLGAGATFPQPLYSKMFDAYYNQFKIKINYQGIGSGAGIEQLTKKTVDFGATDSFMTDEDLKNAAAEIIHVPIALGAVSVTYNLPTNPQIRLSRDILASIFLGTISQWDDEAIAALNADIDLPALPITIVHRSDGSGTTAIFTEYLSKISPEWATTVGRGKEVSWPAGLGAKGNPGVAGQIKQIPGSIGYVELIYALENEMPIAEIQNKKGNYVMPSLESTKLSADVPVPDDTRVLLADTDSEQGYPITGLTWVIVYREQSYDGRSQDKAKSLVDLLWWMTHEGQDYCEPLKYAPIPESVVDKAAKIIKSMTYEGVPIMQ